jgi:hypothetical protein
LLLELKFKIPLRGLNLLLFFLPWIGQATDGPPYVRTSGRQSVHVS